MKKQQVLFRKIKVLMLEEVKKNCHQTLWLRSQSTKVTVQTLIQGLSKHSRSHDLSTVVSLSLKIFSSYVALESRELLLAALCIDH